MQNQALTGTVQSGTGDAYPLGGVTVALYDAATSSHQEIGRVTTSQDGRFSIPVLGLTTDAVFYTVAFVSSTVTLMTVVGPEIHDPIVMNELTSVAAAYSMAQFARAASLQGGAPGLRIAAGMNDNLVSTSTGEPSQVLLAPPNADQTVALRSTRSLANLVAACARGDAGAQAQFLALATPPGEAAPADTFQALLNIAWNPANNAGALYTQSQGVPYVFSPPLTGPVDAWTLAVKVNDSGSDNLLFGGPANLAFDRNGYAWISNNVVQGTANSGTFVMVLRPDGTPADGLSGMPRSPVFGGGLLGPGWGVTIDPRGHVWVGNFGWGPATQLPRHGSVSEFLPDGTAVSGDYGHQEGALHRVQATVSDAQGNIWMASMQTGRVVVYPEGDPAREQSLPAGTGTFGVAVAPDGTVWVSSGGGGLGWPTANDGSVSRFRLDNGQLTALPGTVTVGKACKAIATDSLGNAWLASGGDSKVYQLDSGGNVVGSGYDGGGIDTPWGITVDGDDNVWVANFGVMGPESDYTNAALTQLKGSQSGRPSHRAEPGRSHLSLQWIHAAERR